MKNKKIKIPGGQCRPQARFICFIGIDGSGKTTLARRVAGELNGDFHYVHNLIEARFLALPLWAARSLLAGGKSRRSDHAGFSKRKRTIFSRAPFLYAIYTLVALLDYLPQMAMKVVVPLRRGEGIVSDRYVFDTAINMVMNRGYEISRLLRTIRSFLSVLPVPDITFLVDVPEEVAFSRKDDVPDIAYLREKRPIYIELAKRLGMPVLDGTKPVGALLDEVMERIGRFHER